MSHSVQGRKVRQAAFGNRRHGAKSRLSMWWPTRAINAEALPNTGAAVNVGDIGRVRPEFNFICQPCSTLPITIFIHSMTDQSDKGK